MAYSREIFQWIKGAIQFEREDNEHDSHYTQIAGVYVRVSNHCTWMKTWENIFKLGNGKYRNYKGKRILSLVFEDSGSTYKDECLYTEEYHETPIQVTEYVYATPLDKTQVNAIIKNLRGFEQGIMFQDTLGIAEKHDRVSVYPGPNNDGNSDKDYKEQESKTEPIIKEYRLKSIIRESIYQVLNENARDKRVLDFLKSKGYEDYNERMQIIGRLKHDIPNLRLDGNKFLLGACRMDLDGQLRDKQSIRKVDNALKFIHADGHTGEFDENLNGKSPDELHEMFREVSRQMNANDRQRSASQQFSGGSQYRIIPINSYKEAKPYGKYTPWCVTHGKDAFDSNTQGGNRFYFCLKDGFESVPKDDDGAPLNEWGLSMIAVNIDMNGDLTRTTTRYNHDFNGENNPELETTEQLEKVLNVPFYQTFKPYTREELHKMGIIPFDEVEELLDAGTPPEKIFQFVGDFSEGFARVSLNDKWNLIDKNGKFLSNTWFDNASNFSEGFAAVKLNYKYNFIDRNGKLLSNTWFDDMWNSSEGSAWVELNGKYNFIDKNGKLLSNTWFDSVGNFSEGFARVELNYKYNFIDKNCKLLSNTWFDSAGNFSEGFARVSLNDKYNFIDTHGNLYDEKPSIQENRRPIKITESDIRMMVSEAVERLVN